jgi:hypothetical protein
MATRGFEFAYSLDGDRPTYRDYPVSGTGTYAIGDLLVFTSGKLAKAANTVATVSAVCQEARDSGVDGGLLKVAVITKDQVWRCSSDGTSLTAALGARTQDIVDSNTIDADDAANGSLAVYDTAVDDDGNVLVYVNFTLTTFG